MCTTRFFIYEPLLKLCIDSVNISSNSEVCDESMPKIHCVKSINVDLNQETKFVSKIIKE